MAPATAWGIPFVAAPAPEQGGEPTSAARVRYVVQNVEPSTPLSSAHETVWRVRLRPGGAAGQPASSALFVLLPAQAPERAAPYAVGAAVQIDPRLVDRE